MLYSALETEVPLGSGWTEPKTCHGGSVFTGGYHAGIAYSGAHLLPADYLGSYHRCVPGTADLAQPAGKPRGRSNLPGRGTRPHGQGTTRVSRKNPDAVAANHGQWHRCGRTAAGHRWDVGVR